MKKLKKLLAVVLVIALAFSLMATVSAANVSDYSDADDVTYTEAVDLFTALGFLSGMGDGTFDPTGLVTREQAAKIITYMLIGSDRADALTTAISSFSDVAVDRWSAPYIEYCATLGIISGRGDGTFDPAGNVTGTEFAKMLLCAIGYGVKDEYTGANWAMKTIADAQSLNILSLAVDYSAAATREECSQYGFNAYTKCNTVVYNSTTLAYQQAIDIDGQTAKGSLATQQGVNKTTSTYTLNGTTYYRWTKNGVELTGGYTKEKVIGTNTMGVPLSYLTDSTSSYYIASLDTSVDYYYNGTLLTQLPTGTTAVTAIAGNVYYNTTEKAVVLDDGDGIPEAIASDASVIAAGVIVKLVNTDSDSKAETVQIIKKSVAILSGDPVVSGSYVTISAISGLSGVSIAKVPGYDTLSDNDVVLWYKNTTTGYYYIDVATAVVGTVSSYVNATTVTLEGATYYYSGLGFGGSFTNTSVNDWAGLASTTLYLDDGGYVCYGKQATVSNPAASYCFVTDADTAAYVTSAKVIFSDGTSATVTLASTSLLNGATSATPLAFYKYAVTSSGTYVLSALPTGYTSTPLGASINIATAAVNYSTSANDDPANAKTRFVYEQVTSAAGAYTLYPYTGIANVPKFTGDANTAIYELGTGTNAIFVFAYSPLSSIGSFTATTTTGDWVYVMSGNYTTNWISTTLQTRSYQVAFNGVYASGTTLTVDASTDTVINGQPGLYRVTGYDTNGYATIIYPAGGTTATSPVSVASNGTDVYGTKTTTLYNDSLTISSGVISYSVPVTGVITAQTPLVLSDSAKIYLVDTTNQYSTGVTFYEISASQANALDSNGAKIDMYQVSGTDTSIAAVYIRDTSASGSTTTTSPTTGTAPAAPSIASANGVTATATLTSVVGNIATYTVVFDSAGVASTGANTYTITGGVATEVWAAGSSSGTASTAPTGFSTAALAFVTGNTLASYTVTYSVTLTAAGTPAVTIIVT